MLHQASTANEDDMTVYVVDELEQEPTTISILLICFYGELIRIIIAIKHVFLCINICWVPREVFNISRGTQRMLMHGKTCLIAIIT